MIRRVFLIGLFASLICTTAFAGETIAAQEVEGYFYADGEMKRSEPQFEITYYVEGDTVTRTRVYDINKKAVTPDNTVYQIQRQLASDPTKGLSLSGKPIIRAIGQPGTDAFPALRHSKQQCFVCSSGHLCLYGSETSASEFSDR